MNKIYNTITLCGSTRFKDNYIRVQKELKKDKEILQVVLDKDMREYVRKVAYDAGCTEDFMIEAVLKDYDRMLSEQ